VIEDVPTLMPPTPDEREAHHIAASKFGQTAVEASWVPRHVRGMGEALCRAPLAVLDARGGRSGHQPVPSVSAAAAQRPEDRGADSLLRPGCRDGRKDGMTFFG
jgi:hypothetical protein